MSREFGPTTLEISPRRDSFRIISLKELRRECKIQNRSLSPRDCKEQLKLLGDLYSRSTIIIDALDECKQGDRSTGRQALLEILLDLVDSKRKHPFNVFVSGRGERDLQVAFKKRATIAVEDNADDIRRFVEYKTEHGFPHLDMSQRKEITEKILERCKSV